MQPSFSSGKQKYEKDAKELNLDLLVEILRNVILVLRGKVVRYVYMYRNNILPFPCILYIKYCSVINGCSVFSIWHWNMADATPFYKLHYLLQGADSQF